MAEEKQEKLTYRDAGVDIDAGNYSVTLIKDSVKATYRPEVLGDLGGFGRLLDESWRLKRGLSDGISTGAIDEVYEAALKAGALGGKLLGAGGGGFLLFYVEPEQQAAVRSALHELLYVPFQFENSGTTVVHYTAEDYELEEER